MFNWKSENNADNVKSVLFYVIRELNWKPAIDVEIDKVILLLKLTLSTNQIQVYDTIVVNLMEIIDDFAILK